ncbi:4729_t:CDS:2 [Ambispora leptoticha]|uniref:dolichol kinase n=1 Tax=Ambispora leptoticha TaxID=144679 RepID=A0A9N9B3L5_9GLOM|nr:4729_t:CDS:2 [Ambispora leptoticha]
MVENGGVDLLGKTSLEHYKKLGMSHPQQPHPSTASLVERLIMVVTALLATVRLLQTMPSSKNGYVEGIGSVQLDLIWHYWLFGRGVFIRFVFQTLDRMGIEYGELTTDVDDGSFYGALLIPIMAVAKLVDIHKSSKNDSYTELPWHYVIFSQTFYHASLYTIAYLFKRSFTFGELAIVAQSITLLVVEAWVVTVNELEYIELPKYMKIDPHPITIFQIALILGMLVIGILLSPFFLRSRYLAQQPMWKTKDPHSFEIEKRWTACIIYGGTIIIVVCGLGQWVQLVLKANPYSW